MTNLYKQKLTYLGALMCLITAFFYGYEYFLRVAPAVLQLELVKIFHISAATFGIISAGFYYAYVPLQLPVGMLMDKYGPKKILSIACLICSIGTYLFAIAQSIKLLFIGRVLLGAGSAFAFVGVLKIATNWLPKKYFGLMAGLASSLGMLGGILGEKLMLVLINEFGWRATLIGSVIVGMALTMVIFFTLKNQPENLIDNNQEPEWELSTALKSIITKPQIWLAGIIGCLTFVTLSAFAESWAVPFINNGLGYDLHTAANGSALVFMGFGFGGPAWGIISFYLKSKKWPIFFGSLIASISISIILTTNLNINLIYLLLFVLGFASSCEVLVFAIGDDIAEKHTHASTIAFINFLIMLGGIFLLPIIGYIIDCNNNNYFIGISIIPICLFLASLLALKIK